MKNPDVSDTWFDDLKIQKVFSSKIKSVKNTSKKKINDNYKIILSGRYLVRSNENFTDSQSTEKRNHLIELNSLKQEALTKYLQELSYISKIQEKTFSIEGDGDLFNRYFTHFKYVFISNM